MSKQDDQIDETEVWSKFSATHHYQRNAMGVMVYVKSSYFQLDPFNIESAQPISKADLVALLEPAMSIDDN